MSERYFSGDVSRTLVQIDDNEAEDSRLILSKEFPWFKAEHYFSISSPAVHELFGEKVITCFLPESAITGLGLHGFVLGARKFCIDSKASFIRLYSPVINEQAPDWLPKSGKILFVGENHEEYGRPYNKRADTFSDIYFSGDPEEVEAAFGLPVRRGKYETFYGATVQDGKPVRVKQYIYDEQDGFSDWDVVWMMHAKKAGAWPPSN